MDLTALKKYIFLTISLRVYSNAPLKFHLILYGGIIDKEGFQFALGHPCPSLTVANSNTENRTGVYETVHTISCNYGYVTPDMNSMFAVECQNNGTWNTTTCNSK